jgi:hypothetical protein
MCMFIFDITSNNSLNDIEMRESLFTKILVKNAWLF